jgi:hypothetical protein
MSKERYNQIIDETYKNYEKEYEKGFHLEGTGLLWMAKESKETFIYKLKTDNEFSEKWGLKIEERELSLEERTEILKDQSDNKEYFYDNNGNLIIESEWVLNKSNIPTKLITVTYKDEIIESYDND